MTPDERNDASRASIKANMRAMLDAIVAYRRGEVRWSGFPMAADSKGPKWGVHCYRFINGLHEDRFAVVRDAAELPAAVASIERST